MVAFAGRKYAARSLPTLVVENTNIITSFTLVTSFIINPYLANSFTKITDWLCKIKDQIRANHGTQI